LSLEQQHQVNAIAKVVIDVIHAHAIGTTIRPEDIEQGWARRLPARRAQEQSISFEDAKHIRAVATVAVQRMLEYFDAPREHLVALLVHAVTRLPISRSEVRAIGKTLTARAEKYLPRPR
jgi:hypothetical protein